MSVAPAVFVSSKTSFGSVGREAGPLLQRQAGDGGARPDRHHAVAVFAEDQGLHLRRRHLQAAGQVAAEAARVELRAQAEDALPRQAGALHRQVGQHVHRVADHDEVRVVLQAGRLDLIENAQKEIDVAVDEVEPALVRLAAQAGRDDDDVAGGDCRS